MAPVVHQLASMSPDQLALAVAAIAATGAVLASILTAILGVHNSGKLEVIHVLVNSQLAEIKAELVTALDAAVKAEAENRELRAKLAALPPEPPA